VDTWGPSSLLKYAIFRGANTAFIGKFACYSYENTLFQQAARYVANRPNARHLVRRHKGCDVIQAWSPMPPAFDTSHAFGTKAWPGSGDLHRKQILAALELGHSVRNFSLKG